MCGIWGRYYYFDQDAPAHVLKCRGLTPAVVTFGGTRTAMCMTCFAHTVIFDSGLESTVTALSGWFVRAAYPYLQPLRASRIGRGKRIDAKFLAALVEAQHVG